jgi:outer membrane protein TolC
MIYKELVYQKIIKIVLILSLSLLASCANRGPLPFSFDFLKKSADEDIEKISKIRKQNEILQKNLDIDLYTAIALAIENNKDLKVKLFETALADRQLKDVKFDMLPTMSANAGYSGSDNYQSSTSATVGNNDSAAAKGSTYSTSRNRDVVDQDIGFAWNALDFGLSYIRAGQTGDRFLIAKEIEKKSANNIAKEVIRSYWNALSADKLIQKYDPLIKKVKIALSDSEKIEEMLLQKPMDALLYQKELLDIKRALITQRQTLINSKIELGTLMGLLPNQSYKLVATNQPINILDMDLKNMEKHALVSRAELLENRYQERISVAETKVGLRSLLPNFNINAAFTSSSNDYLQNKSNFEFGSSVGANLLNVFRAPSIKKMNEANTEIIKEQRLALSMAILSQVHLANIDFQMSMEEYDTAERYLKVSTKIA